ncbi:PREDICTED: odorant receptor 13a-like [Dufourea novaeangliae]|uniref:odorant receptor 13a-like n=1 Tax=Dufourea novaeangliae TaxID=178035 RepID=UPI0007679CC7|nr:PREDICTED: odorant receptor 13a-like [Dufourea novaeangliae]
MTADWENTSVTKHSLDAMIRKTQLSNWCSQLILSVYAIAVFLYSSVYINVFRKAGRDDVIVDSSQLLMRMELPLASYERPAYQYVMIAQFVQLMFVATAIGTIDAFMITLILHVGGQVEMMHQALAAVCSKNKEQCLPKSTVKRLVNRHQKILNFTKYIENLFSYIALMQILCNTISICCIGFLMVVSFDTDQNLRNVIKILFFYIAIVLEAFIFCFAGEYLSSKSTSINSAAYNSLWYLWKPNESRTMLLFMIRSQKRSTITAGNVMELSLEGFATIMKASASYMSVLLAMS